MTTVRQSVESALADGTLDGESLLTEVRGIGPYLAARMARALRRTDPMTLEEFWDATRRRRDPLTLVRLAVQNERGNQCVATRVGGERRRRYHAGDLNEHGYQAFATLLNHARSSGTNVAYAPLPWRLPPRAPGSKTCGCTPRAACAGACAWTGTACVPRAHNATGFEGVRAHTHQREDAANERRVRRASRTAAAHRGDPDTRRDLRNNSRSLRYDRRGSRLWRRPGSRVRLPLR